MREGIFKSSCCKAPWVAELKLLSANLDRTLITVSSMAHRANRVISYVSCRIYCISRAYMKEVISKMVQVSSINLQLTGEGVLSRFATCNFGDILYGRPQCMSARQSTHTSHSLLMFKVRCVASLFSRKHTRKSFLFVDFSALSLMIIHINVRLVLVGLNSFYNYTCFSFEQSMDIHDIIEMDRY
jgi:hypothetical protein